MRIPYEDDLPLVLIRVVGSSGEKEFKAHLDFAASKTLVPSNVADELNLPFEGFVPVATGGGTILMPLFKAKVIAFDKSFNIYIACFDLPKESPIQALLGRDILDDFEICFDGRKKEIIIEE